MEKEKLILKAAVREEKGKARALRRQGLIPAVIYSKGSKTINITVDGHDFPKVYKKSGHTGIIQVKVNDKTKNVLVHELDRDGVSNKVLHVDFYAVKMNEKITAFVPLNFVGEAPAVKEQDGTLIRQKDEVEVEAFPADLPQQIDVDLSALINFESVIHVKDLPVPTEVKMLTGDEEPVAMIEPPRSDEELAELEETVEEEMVAEEVEVEAAAEAAGEEKEITKDS
ncbi:MAG: ribosomal 5S rRNA E-loop binding protein Ctc/L25/TL5, large subunit ribosomal protein L25 [candidate division CPR2 bacterium GW2011_GWC1_39_9]|nr:MAG: ribosomal 5S rRNA E-loop binding protein Ctc/L25/TL5, large subunit ribosomal protein L25 [candidate division CPR2 bacterium GW2011_GWC1_39_9]